MSKPIDFHTNPSAQTTNFDWWPDGKLKRITDPVGQIDFEYDGVGRLHTVTQGNATITRTYDDLDRLESFTDSNGNTIGYEYDGSGNLKKLTYPDLKEVTYAYDAADRLDSITDWGNRTVDFQYDVKTRGQSLHLLTWGFTRRWLWAHCVGHAAHGVRRGDVSRHVPG